jgi:hypothetical protein
MVHIGAWASVVVLGAVEVVYSGDCGGLLFRAL